MTAEWILTVAQQFVHPPPHHLTRREKRRSVERER
jgi:hypothetical protein